MDEPSRTSSCLLLIADEDDKEFKVVPLLKNLSEVQEKAVRKHGRYGFSNNS